VFDRSCRTPQAPQMPYMQRSTKWVLGPMGLRYAPSLRGRSCRAKAVPGEDTANTPSNKDAVRLQSPSQTRVNKEGSVRDLHSSRRQEPTSHNQSHQSPYGLSKSLREGPQGRPMHQEGHSTSRGEVRGEGRQVEAHMPWVRKGAPSSPQGRVASSYPQKSK